VELTQVKGNTYVLSGWKLQPVYVLPEGRCILLDSGMPNERERIEATLKQAGLTVTGILCTHAHIDHASGNAYFREKYGAKVAMPAGEAGLCVTPLSVAAHVVEINPARVLQDLSAMVCPVDVAIAPEEDIVELCGVPFRVIHTPGHSPDHAAYVTPDGVCYVGDALLSGRDLEAKLPCSFHPMTDLKTKPRLKGLDCSAYVVAHRGIYEEIDGLVDDNLRLLNERMEAIRQLIDVPLSMDQIVARVCRAFGLHGEEIPKVGYYEKNVRNYVYALYDQGRLSMTVIDGVRHYKT
jgi:hydroxyacylglutathione hydrolase